MQYDLPRSVSILPDCKNAVFNTARISSQSSQIKMVPVISGAFWESYIEETVSANDSDMVAMDGLWEQINVTRDASDYLWYLTELLGDGIYKWVTWIAQLGDNAYLTRWIEVRFGLGLQIRIRINRTLR
ncbi:hypothetical protein LOK49_LG02G02607 [Camellia lanceoleosa]|uniref:Uncharacterized protein n=1 Tax=Camellia lanceoleosa TaxID=1840588 RepID=A0ACC0IPM2_9ERIC|nr:hypothetical protein LOK49_LG02G02607 [Camellia lanceoleosa]